MKGSRCAVLAGSWCAMALSMSIAQASGTGTMASGTITFVGTIVAPTCSMATEPALSAVAASEAVAIQPHRQICSGPGGDAANAARIYTVNVVSLSASESDPVLKYFDHYVKASGPDAKDPVLVTQTYE
ncbi:MAG: hypothetical protein ACREPQ_06750 [Rhodanobacter sp.]